MRYYRTVKLSRLVGDQVFTEHPIVEARLVPDTLPWEEAAVEEFFYVDIVMDTSYLSSASKDTFILYIAPYRDEQMVLSTFLGFMGVMSEPVSISGVLGLTSVPTRGAVSMWKEPDTNLVDLVDRTHLDNALPRQA